VNRTSAYGGQWVPQTGQRSSRSTVSQRCSSVFMSMSSARTGGVRVRRDAAAAPRSCSSGSGGSGCRGATTPTPSRH